MKILRVLYNCQTVCNRVTNLSIVWYPHTGTQLRFVRYETSSPRLRLGEVSCDTTLYFGW